MPNKTVKEHAKQIRIVKSDPSIFPVILGDFFSFVTPKGSYTIGALAIRILLAILVFLFLFVMQKYERCVSCGAAILS